MKTTRKTRRQNESNSDEGSKTKKLKTETKKAVTPEQKGATESDNGVTPGVKSSTTDFTGGKKSKKQEMIKKEEAGDVKPVVALAGNDKLVGAHVSAAGGLQNAPTNAAAIGAKSFAMFLKSQRQWNAKPLEDATVKLFKAECEKHGFLPHCILPHGSYLVNCGSPDPNTLAKSRAALIDELQRCEKLGLTLYNFHPGSSCGKISVEKCLDVIGESINLAHEQTKYVITVVENMSRQGNTVGGDFKELRGIIDRVKDKSRIGICIDTCHAFAAGYDLSTAKGYAKMMEEFDKVVGFKYLKALHLNDSKAKVGSHLDRHEQLGKGFIGKGTFEIIMNDSRLSNIPMILETPDPDAYEREINLLNSFV